MIPRHQSLPPSANVDRNARTQSQEWGQQSQAPMRTQYSALPPFTSGQVSTREQYLLSNHNAPLAHQSPRTDSRRPSTFAIPPEHHLHFPQNLESVQQAPMPPAQVPSTRINDFMSTGGPSHHVNGWELSATGNTMGGTWNQQSHHASVASTPISLVFKLRLLLHCLIIHFTSRHKIIMPQLLHSQPTIVSVMIA